jgi:hypothetical protein
MKLVKKYNGGCGLASKVVDLKAHDLLGGAS